MLATHAALFLPCESRVIACVGQCLQTLIIPTPNISALLPFLTVHQ